MLIVVGACASHASPAEAPVPPPKPSSQCDQVADHLVSQMTAASKASAEEIDPYRRLLSRRCNEDKWSTELQQCLLGTNTLKENKSCEHLFTDDQNANLERDGEAAEKAAKQSAAPEEKEEATGGSKSDPPPPPAPTPSRSRGPAPKGGHKAGDPCEGGQ